MKLVFIEGPKDGSEQEVTTPPVRVTVPVPLTQMFDVDVMESIPIPNEVRISGQYIPTGWKNRDGALIYLWNPQ